MRNDRHRDSYRARLRNWDEWLSVAATLFMALFGFVYLLAAHPQTPAGLVTAAWKIVVYEVLLASTFIGLTATKNRLLARLNARRQA